MTKFDLSVNRSGSTQGHNVNNLGCTCIDNATYQVQGHQSIGSGEEDFLRFLPYMGMAAMLVM